jgi:acyl-CoA reductase-like NAD-dependent aldehyde dehydrogenase
LAHAFEEAGFPPGSVNIVIGNGSECGEALVCHKDVSLISFTGSTAIGKKIAELAAKTNKKVSLEMGGKNASIVFGDVDLEEVIPQIGRSCFANQGEICLCTERLYVHSSIYDKFLNSFIENAKKVRFNYAINYSNLATKTLTTFCNFLNYLIKCFFSGLLVIQKKIMQLVH